MDIYGGQRCGISAHSQNRDGIRAHHKKRDLSASARPNHSAGQFAKEMGILPPRPRRNPLPRPRTPSPLPCPLLLPSLPDAMARLDAAADAAMAKLNANDGGGRRRASL